MAFRHYILAVLSCLYIIGYTEGACPSGYTLLGEKCYVFESTEVDYWTAIRKCQTGHKDRIFEPRTLEEWNLVSNHWNTELFWIGMHDNNLLNYVFQSSKSPISVANYTMWATNKPNGDNTGTSQHAVHRNSAGLWNDHDSLARTHSYICERAHCFMGYETICEENYIKIKDKCYYMPSATNGTFFEAVSYCESQGAILAEPRSNEDYLYLMDYWRDTDFWLGLLTNIELINSVYTSDGFPANLLSLFPDLETTKETCNAHHSAEDAILFHECTFQSHNFLCEKQSQPLVYDGYCG